MLPRSRLWERTRGRYSPAPSGPQASCKNFARTSERRLSSRSTFVGLRSRTRPPLRRLASVFGDDHLTRWSRLEDSRPGISPSLAVVGRQDRVIEMNGHVASPESSWSFSRSIANHPAVWTAFPYFILPLKQDATVFLCGAAMVVP